MASKNKKHGRGPAPLAGDRLEVERLLAKLQLKDAVHAAKLCYKKESTPEHHRLLERAYLLRADQLRRGGMPAAAQEVAQHLLDFGVTDPALVEQAAALLMTLGMTRSALTIQGRLDTPEVRESLARQEADFAVVHPDRSSQVPPEVRAGAEMVRTALASLQAGDEASALEALRDVARSSPWSDWKLFVRGLAAFSRRETDGARANWDRLDPKRAAAGIARALSSLNPSNGAAPNASINLVDLERQVFGEPILGPLEELGKLVAQNRWRDALRKIAWLRIRLLRIDPKLAERLTSVMLHPLINAVQELEYDESEEMLDEFIRSAQPLAIDPRWNRLRALVWEGPSGALEGLEDYWRDYLRDLETLPVFTSEERRLAQAMVWEHLGDEISSQIDPNPGLPGVPPIEDDDDDDDDKEDDAVLKERAIQCFEQSLRLAPEYLGAYRSLLEARREWAQPDEAAAVARRLLERFPDDLATLTFLTHYHFRREQSEPALEYVCRARALKPLDQEVARDEFGVRMLRARNLAGQGHWDEGRSQFSAAALAWPEESQSYHFKARQAVFELKAGETERGEALIAETLESLPEATPFWLALLIEAIRYKLPKADRERFDARWTKEQCRKIRSETAGALAGLMASFVGGDLKYEGRDAHVTQVVDYLRRGSRIKYRQSDLTAVCTFLALVPHAGDLRDKMVERGKKLYPKAPWFHLIAGGLALENAHVSPGNLWLARNCFQTALSLAEASKDPGDARLVPRIQQSLSMINDLSRGLMSMPFDAFGGGPFPFSDAPASFAEMVDVLNREFEIDYYGDDEDDDDFDDDEPALDRPVMGRHSAPKRGPKPKAAPAPKPTAKPKPKPKPKKG